jgi:hypothetical protein
VTIGNESVTLGIWDTAGAERYESMRFVCERKKKKSKKKKKTPQSELFFSVSFVH